LTNFIDPIVNSKMAGHPDIQNILILGAGVIGLTTSLVLSHRYPSAKITIVAKHFPGDRSIEYTSPWAGANWSSMATDNGPLEKYDEVTFHRFGELIDGKSVFGCKTSKAGETKNQEGGNAGNEIGLGRMGMWAVFDTPIEEAGILTEETGKVWYDKLVGGLRKLGENELPKDAAFGIEIPQTFRINTQIYLQWYVSHHPYNLRKKKGKPHVMYTGTNPLLLSRLQQQALSKGITLVRRHYPSISSLLQDNQSTTLLINATGIGSLTLSDIRDENLYPTRGQTLLVAEPPKPIERMYEFERVKYGMKPSLPPLCFPFK
jgi:D-amino-acid oxidase